ncbi:MAG: TolC family protein [Macellibacteroides fermentans]|uniref:TolC family protein n=1 Tax=Macellibacteroides fermentans TaxID=879969 RepID=UPI003AD23987
MWIALWFSSVTIYASETDSLTYYLRTAAQNNPQVKAAFAGYKASLERIPQAGAYADPELEIGYFLEPMETLMGKQKADFTLMQMFPWFGTQKAARTEAAEMARMKYEEFRDSQNNLYYSVKSQWYQLCNLKEQYKNTAANIELLKQLEQLAIRRFSAPGSPSVINVRQPVVSANQNVSATSSGMSGMSGMAASSNAGTASTTQPVSGGNMTPMASMGSNGATGGLSDVLRIQLEISELENDLQSIQSNRIAAEAAFNALLNRNQQLPVAVPDTLIQSTYMYTDQAVKDSLFSNPMLSMIDAEKRAYKAKAEMDKKMSYPMFGIGLQYSILGKTSSGSSDMNTAVPMNSMNGKDMVMPMVKISIPIFRKKYNAQQRESAYYRQASELKYTDILNIMMSDYSALKQQLEEASRKITLYEKQYQLSLSTYHLITREFSSGSATLTDVIGVERQLLDYRLKKSEAVADYNTRVAGIEKLIARSLE